MPEKSPSVTSLIYRVEGSLHEAAASVRGHQRRSRQSMTRLMQELDRMGAAQGSPPQAATTADNSSTYTSTNGGSDVSEAVCQSASYTYEWGRHTHPRCQSYQIISIVQRSKLHLFDIWEQKVERAWFMPVVEGFYTMVMHRLQHLAQRLSRAVDRLRPSTWYSVVPGDPHCGGDRGSLSSEPLLSRCDAIAGRAGGDDGSANRKGSSLRLLLPLGCVLHLTLCIVPESMNLLSESMAGDRSVCSEFVEARLRGPFIGARDECAFATNQSVHVCPVQTASPRVAAVSPCGHLCQHGPYVTPALCSLLLPKKTPPCWLPSSTLHEILEDHCGEGERDGTTRVLQTLLSSPILGDDVSLTTEVGEAMREGAVARSCRAAWVRWLLQRIAALLHLLGCLEASRSPCAVAACPKAIEKLPVVLPDMNFSLLHCMRMPPSFSRGTLVVLCTEPDASGSGQTVPLTASPHPCATCLLDWPSSLSLTCRLTLFRLLHTEQVRDGRAEGLLLARRLHELSAQQLQRHQEEDARWLEWTTMALKHDLPPPLNASTPSMVFAEASDGVAAEQDGVSFCTPLRSLGDHTDVANDKRSSFVSVVEWWETVRCQLQASGGIFRGGTNACFYQHCPIIACLLQPYVHQGRLQ